MDPLHFCVAVVPLAVYLLMIGYLNLRRTPFVTTGSRDVASLAIAVVGFVIAGPMELFFPESAASQFGPLVWAMLLGFYALAVSLIVLLMRARIVVYNVTAEQLRPILFNVATKLDPGSRWVGQSLLMPDRDVHLHLEPVQWLRNVQLTAGGNQQNYDGWQELERELSAALNEIRIGPNLLAIPLILTSAGMAALAAWWMLTDQAAVAEAFDQMRRM